MSLNNDAIDDLPKDTLVDDDIIKSSNVSNLNDKTTVIIPQNDIIKNDVTNLSEDQVQQFIDTNIEFKLVNDGVEKIVDLKEVESELLAQESIDRNSIKYFDSEFEGLITERLSLETFTIAPSRTNYKDVKKIVNDRIAKEELDVLTGFNAFTTKSLNEVVTVLNKIKDEYLQPFQDNMSELFNISESVVADISGSKNTIVPILKGEHVEFVDIANLDLLQVEFNALKLSDDSKDKLSKYKSNIENILNNGNVKTLIVLCLDVGKVSYPINKEVITRVYETPISLLMLAKLFISNAFTDHIKSFDTELYQLTTDINKLIEESKSINDYELLKDYLLNNSKDIYNFINKSIQIAGTINNLNNLAFNVKELFLFLSELAQPK